VAAREEAVATAEAVPEGGATEREERAEAALAAGVQVEEEQVEEEMVDVGTEEVGMEEVE
jgi:hypothetical protein